MIDPQSAQPAVQQSERRRIVVVMDNRNNSVLVGRALHEGHDVTLAIPRRPEDFAGIDLVIIDGVSLHRYGREIALARAMQFPLQLPVLLLTDREQPSFLPRALETLVDDVIQRPMTTRELAMRVRALLRSRALSLDIARVQGLYETERAVAQRFQEAALPSQLPSVDGISLSAWYQAGHRTVQVGGDWYDALALDDGRLVLSIGDVCGSGLDAAVLMARVRQVIRGAAQIHPDPQMMLDAANRDLRSEGGESMVTALAGVLDPVASTFNYANAGHVPPLLRAADGRVTALASGDLPLGVGEDLPSVHTIEIPASAALLLYTDGLTEFDRDLLATSEKLQETFSAGEILLEKNPARAIFSRIVQGEPPDDVAILLVAMTERKSRRFAWSFRSDDEKGFFSAARSIAAILENDGFDSDHVTTSELILAELVGNAVRYAPGPVEVVLDKSGGRATLHVLDIGPSFTYAPRLPTNILSENGRGLYLVKELSRDFNVSPRLGGGSHARAVLKAYR